MFNRHKLLSNVGKSHSNVMIGLSRDIEHNLNNLSNGQASNGLIYSDGQFKSSVNSDQRQYIDGQSCQIGSLSFSSGKAGGFSKLLDSMKSNGSSVSPVRRLGSGSM